MALNSQVLIPADEAQRLASIRKYDVLHSLQETVFEEFVALTARIFGLPISLIALVDETQVWYSASYGLPNIQAQPRQEALCSTVILHDSVVVYADLITETSPLITPDAAAAQAKAFGFYAGAPLRTPDAHRVGALCVVDRQPRTFNADEQRLLEQIAALISRLVAVRHCCLATAELGEEQWKMVREQVQEEMQGLVALVRYVITRHGTQIPVSQDLTILVNQRLNDLREMLEEYKTENKPDWATYGLAS